MFANPLTQKQRKTKIHDLDTACRVLSSCPDQAADAGDTHTLKNHGYLVMGNPKDPQFEPQAQVKMVQIPRSPFHICDSFSTNFVALFVFLSHFVFF